MPISVFNNEWLKFVIKDTGVGFTTKAIQDMYEIFPSGKTNSFGVGLGLHISNLISKQLGGTNFYEGIQIESEIGGGTEFTMCISGIDNDSEIMEDNATNPLHNYCETKHKFIDPKTFIEHDEKSNIINKTPRILLVDDDIICRHAIENFLHKFPVSYTSAQNGKEALEIILEEKEKNNAFNLILMDCDMPIMNGFDCSQEINKMIENKIIPYVPIMAITANVAKTDVDLCYRAGMKYFLEKPFSFAAFTQKMKDIIKVLPLDAPKLSE